MIQRYDISMDFEANCLSIKEFAAIGRVSRKMNTFKTEDKKFSMVQNITYDGDTIRSAMNEGKGALFSAIRSDDFFPIHTCMDIIAEKVIELFEDKSNSCSEVIFDDHEQFGNSEE